MRYWRAKREWSQAQLASQCQLRGLDCSRDTIAKIEAGTRVVSDHELLTLARTLGTTPNDLLGVSVAPESEG